MEKSRHVVWVIALIFTAIFGYFFYNMYGVYQKTGDWDLFFILVLTGIGCIIAVMLYKEWRKTKRLEALKRFTSSHIEHFKCCSVGMPCDDYSLLFIAGPNSHELPVKVRDLMAAHEEACAYHQAWHQSALDTPVTDAMEHAAAETIKKYK